MANPMPRNAPVTNATRPERLPMPIRYSHSNAHHAGSGRSIDEVLGPGNETRLIAREKRDESRDFLHTSHSLQWRHALELRTGGTRVRRSLDHGANHVSLHHPRMN